MKWMHKFQVKEADVCHRFGIAERKALSKEDLVTMFADIKAIDSGEVRAEELYPPSASDDLAAKVQARAAEVAGDPKTEPKPPAEPTPAPAPQPAPQPTPPAPAEPAEAKPEPKPVKARRPAHAQQILQQILPEREPGEEG
jgi:hypothetical protein